MTFRAKYYSSKIDAGVYMQMHDDGERAFVIVHHTDGIWRDEAGWYFGEVTRWDWAGIQLRNQVDPLMALDSLKGKAKKGPYRTKRDAIESAIKREAVSA